MRTIAYAVAALGAAAVVYETFQTYASPAVVLLGVLAAGVAATWISDHPRPQR